MWRSIDGTIQGWSTRALPVQVLPTQAQPTQAQPTLIPPSHRHFQQSEHFGVMQ